MQCNPTTQKYMLLKPVKMPLEVITFDDVFSDVTLLVDVKFPQVLGFNSKKNLRTYSLAPLHT